MIWALINQITNEESSVNTTEDFHTEVLNKYFTESNIWTSQVEIIL